MKRVKFKQGEQRKFLEKVLKELNCPSLRALNQFGFEVSYSTLKNYFIEARMLPEDFFNDLCYLAKINKKYLNFKLLNENWGQVLGGSRKREGTFI
jgi:hypothetical protein